MPRDPVRINHDAIIECVLRAMLDRLREFDTPVAIACFDGMHAHVLARRSQHNPKIVIGIAKQYATAQLKEHLKTHGEAVGFQLSLKRGEGIWAKGSHPKPIEDQRHFESSFNYVNDHRKRGAIVITPEPTKLKTRKNLTEAEFLQDFRPLE